MVHKHEEGSVKAPPVKSKTVTSYITHHIWVDGCRQGGYPDYSNATWATNPAGVYNPALTTPQPPGAFPFNPYQAAQPNTMYAGYGQQGITPGNGATGYGTAANVAAAYQQYAQVGNQQQVWNVYVFLVVYICILVWDVL